MVVEARCDLRRADRPPVFDLSGIELAAVGREKDDGLADVVRQEAESITSAIWA